MVMPRIGGGIQQAAIVPMKPIDYHQSRNDLATAQEMTVPAGSSPRYLMMQAVDQNCRFTLTDATVASTPTEVFGFLLAIGDVPIIIPVDAGITVRVIEEAVTATLQYQWFE